MSSLTKSMLSLAAFILIITSCTIANPTAAPTEQVVNIPSQPAIAQLLPTTPPTELPEFISTATTLPTNTQRPVTTPPPLGGSGVILFGSNRGGDYINLYLLDKSSGIVTQLTMDDSNIFPGPFSPDGNQLLFTGFGLTNSFVGLMNADGTDVVGLSQRPSVDEGFPAWSPDGSQIAFTSRMDGNNEIYIMEADGTQPIRITDNPADDFAPSWSPDGTKIAFVSDRDNPTSVNNLYLMNLDGTGVTRLTTGDEIDYGPAWSPDGKQIAFRADVDGNSDIYLVNADGSGRINLTNNPANDWAPTWSPDGSWIAFQTNRDGNWEIYVMRSNGSESTNLTDNPADDQMPYWKPMAAGID